MNPTPAETAHDLRNAALVIDHAGWAIEDWITPTGRVCLDGAIEVATGVTPIVAVYNEDLGAYLHSGRWRTRLVTHAFSGQHYTDDRDYAAHSFYPRRDAAREAVASLIPPCACQTGPAVNGDTDPCAIVTHFNDEHCKGDEDASSLLIQAAEKIEGNLP